MKNKRILFDYLKNQWKLMVLGVCFVLSMCLIYGLYGLPWEPVLYATLIVSALALLFMVLDFYHYAKKIEQLQRLKKQAVLHLEELPLADDLLEQHYLDLASVLNNRCLMTEEKAQQDRGQATRYYTLWSHQIKTPLAAMRLLLQEDALDIKALEQELFKTEQYVHMVLQYQRLYSDTNDLVLQKYALDALVKKAVKKVSTLFIYKKIGIKIGEIPCHILSDEKWLVFVLEQLLTNAVKYTQEGYVSIYLAKDVTDTLVVEDTGIGILPEDLPRVFEWGYTGYNGRLDKHATGIGLSLCKQALDLLGNTITVTSVVGEGTKVSLNLSRDPFDME